jgi:hypothetical protein
MSTATNSIFISYRRTDSADVLGRINDRLVHAFGKDSIFRDIDSIPAGLDFRTYLRNGVQDCKVCLVMIGKGWLDTRSQSGARRLDDPADHHRIEIETALGRGIPVIPVLIQGAPMPLEDELPAGIRELASRNARMVRPDPDFGPDMDRLVNALKQYVPMPGQAASPQLTKAEGGQTGKWIGLAVAGLAVAGGVVYFTGMRPSGDPPPAETVQPGVKEPDVVPAQKSGSSLPPQPKSGPGNVVNKAGNVESAPPPGATPATPTPPSQTPPPPAPDDRDAAFEKGKRGDCSGLERLADRESTDGYVFFELGLCQVRASKTPDAKKSLARALELNETPSRVQTELARIALNEGNFSEATRQVDLALKSQGGYAPALLVRGDIAMKQRKWGDAVKIYDAVFQKTKTKESCLKLADAFEKNATADMAQETRNGCAGLP